MINVMQCILLPCALIPTLKFVGSSKIMSEFALKGTPYIVAVTFGVLLFGMNFVLLFSDHFEALHNNWILVLVPTVLYVWFLYKTISEPLSELAPLTIEE